MEKIKIGIPVVVEGKYDKIKLSSIIDAHIVTTEGFGIFKSKEREALIRTLSRDGIIILTDSDGGGKVIRSKLNGIVPPDKIYNLYIPQIEGKEKRKKSRSKEGFLGVEGIESQVLYKLFYDFSASLGSKGEKHSGESITMADFYQYGYTGHEDSRERRNALAKELGLPQNMNATALLAALNVLMCREEFTNSNNCKK